MRDSTRTCDRARAPARAALACVVLTQAGCYFIAGVGATGAVIGGTAGAIAAGNRPKPITARGAAVTITMDPPRDLTLIGAAGGDTTFVRGASAVVGRVTAEQGDTLFVAPTEAQGARGPATFPAIEGPTTAVVRGPGVSVHVIAASSDRAAKIALGAMLGAALAIGALFLYCGTTRCLD